MNKIGILTIKIIRFDVQLYNQYCRCKDCVFVMIFLVKLPKGERSLT